MLRVETNTNTIYTSEKKRVEHNQVLFLCHLSLEFQSDHT